MRRICVGLALFAVSVIFLAQSGAEEMRQDGLTAGPALLSQQRKKRVPSRRLRVPKEPKVSRVAVSSKLVIRQPGNINIYLKNLPPNADFEFLGIVPPLIRNLQCWYRQNPNIGLQKNLKADQNGEKKLSSVPGWFVKRAYSTANRNCYVSLRIKVQSRFGGKTTMKEYRLISGRIELHPRVTYTIRKTWRLQSKLKFKKVSAYGSCTGKTLPAPNRHNIGVRKYGKDISMHVRSGPTGTDCQFSSKGWLLPDGVEVSSVTYDVIKYGDKGSCCLSRGSACILNFGPNQITSLNFNRGAATISSGRKWGTTYAITSHKKNFERDGRAVRQNRQFSRRLATYLQPMWTRLMCTNTVTNNHGIRLRLKTVKFSGPPGLTIP